MPNCVASQLSPVVALLSTRRTLKSRRRQLALAKFGLNHDPSTSTTRRCLTRTPTAQLRRIPSSSRRSHLPRHSKLQLKRSATVTRASTANATGTSIVEINDSPDNRHTKDYLTTHSRINDIGSTVKVDTQIKQKRFVNKLSLLNQSIKRHQSNNESDTSSAPKRPRSDETTEHTKKYMEHTNSNATATMNGGDYMGYKTNDDPQGDHLTSSVASLSINSNNNNNNNMNNNSHKHFHHQHSSNHLPPTAATIGANHISSNSYLTKAPPPPNKHISAATMATLCNIGNTCYLNSVVYTLRFAPHFLHNLHHLVEELTQVAKRLSNANKAKSSSLGRNVGGLAGANTRSWSTKDLASVGGVLPVGDLPRSQRQIATEKLHDLYNSLRRSESIDSQDAFHADTFLGAVQDVSSIFEGNQQQDAHEFLMCVLDSIRETCQALTKVIVDCPTIINGFASTPDKRDTPPTIQSTPSVRLPFFRKRNKEDKSKQNRLIDSPSKDVNIIASTIGNTTSSVDVIDGKSFVNTTTGGIEGKGSPEEESGQTNDKTKLNERIKELGLDFFTEDFEGVTVSSTKCLTCETVTEQKETMIDLSVPITGYENLDAIENPHQFIQNLCITREHFNSENKYRCEVCTGLTEAIRTVSYPVLPRLLIIQLKRFSGGMEKINSFIPTPFVMQCFCSKCCDLPEGEKLHVYRLYSVITHVGATLSVGHYIAYTTALDGFSDYSSCPKVKRKAAQANAPSGIPPIPTTTTAAEKNPGLIKKIIFGRSKASSSGDVTKHMKSSLNGGGSLKHNISNGTDKGMPSEEPCPALSCCGILTKLSPVPYGQNNGLDSSRSSLYSANSLTSDYYSAGSVNSVVKPILNGVDRNTSDPNSGSAYGSTTQTIIPNGSVNGDKTSSHTSPEWYMCDDDKIKAMSQREFEELLSPNSKKIMITPYLLFYARSDLQP